MFMIAEQRRCQNGKGATQQVDEGIADGSAADGARRGAIGYCCILAVVFAEIEHRDLVAGFQGWQAGGDLQKPPAAERCGGRAGTIEAGIGLGLDGTGYQK